MRLSIAVVPPKDNSDEKYLILTFDNNSFFWSRMSHYYFSSDENKWEQVNGESKIAFLK